MPDIREFDFPALGSPIPQDVKLAIEFMRAAIRRSVSMAELVQHCGVAERTLNRHFCLFLGVSPLRYMRRLRLAAARKALLGAGPGTSVTEIAKRYGFNHFGRFAGQYRQCFGETPSITLRRGRVAAEETTSEGRESGEPEHRHVLPSRERPSIAVLTCESPPGVPSLHQVAESLAEAIAAALSSVRSVAVTAPRGRAAGIREPARLARELGTRYALMGRIMVAGARLRVILRIVETATGHHVWGESFDDDREKLFNLQDRIVKVIVSVIAQSIRGAEIDRVRRARAQDLDAYGLAMRALPLVFASQPEASRRALDLLYRAIEIDPDYGFAPALAAWCHGQLVMYNGVNAQTDERSQAMHLNWRAAILEEEDPYALAARSAVHTMLGEFDVAEALVVRALALDPSFGWAWGRSGWLQAYKGNSETAISHFRRAIRLDPSAAVKANSFIGIGSAHFNEACYEAAADWLQRGMREQPGIHWANRSLSVCYAHLGHRLKAKKSIDRLRRFRPDLTVRQVVAAVPFKRDFLDRLGNGLSDLGLPP